MDKFRNKLVVLTLLFAFVTTSIQAQSSNTEEDTYSSAYMQSSQTAHWSAYVPLTILVVAAVLFGIADRDHNGDDSGQSLGSRYSKSSRYSRSSSGYSHSSSSSNSSYSH